MSSSGVPVVQARNLGKCYQIYEQPHHRLLQGLLRRPMHRSFWALQGASFDVAQGESVGVIGKNGSGKSTLLQLVAGIVPPSAGEISVRGRVSALLELGAGFNPEFTGRENLHLNGALLGMSREEVEEALPRILDFAEIGDYVDQLVKTYSSGMFVRLAFSMAVHSHPEVLIVDEALAVGDVYFQAKCQRRIEQLRSSGCSFLLVTHSVDTLSRLCDRGIVLEAGRVVRDGPVESAVREYLTRVFGPGRGSAAGPVPETAATTGGTTDGLPGAEVPVAAPESAPEWLAGRSGDLFSSRPGYHGEEMRVGTGGAWVADFAFAGRIDEAPCCAPLERVDLFVRYEFAQPSERLVYGMQLRTHEGQLVYSTNTFFLHHRLDAASSGDRRIMHFSFNAALLPGMYRLSLGVSRFDDKGMEIEALDRRIDSILLTVMGDAGRAVGFAELQASIERQPPVVMED
jgi:lipopolysaccharide transport system ATP-binding protein